MVCPDTICTAKSVGMNLDQKKELSPNTTLSHYRIVSKIGEGGMGEVWLAEDTRLGRKVALKLLPAEFTEDSDRVRRFTQEAKAASALNHPNIISVYDIGETETGRFIVMEFVAGHTLRSVIAKDNSLETFFTLGAQMAKALTAAHAAGITHRDIKPDNIMVRDDGYVKMLDFGLARLLPTTSSDPEAATLAQQTTPGTVMGTLAYMSPEQASGKTVGSASDIFALGIVLFELATGSHPFKSETMIGYLHAITSQTPPSMTSIKSHLPPALDDLILRMLEKDENSRPTSIEVVQALQEIEKYGSSNTLPLRIVAHKPKVTRGDEGFWIAVLPFRYSGGNADLITLAEGLSEEIVTGLSRFSYLRVITRSSTMRFSGEAADIRTIGKELGARYVITGSLRLAGSLLRVAVQLVDASTGSNLWAENYERPFRVEEIFALQDELVPKIVATAADRHGVLPHTMSETLRNRDVKDLRPYELVLRGFTYYERATAAEHPLLRAALERAVEQEPGNGDCWAILAILYCDEYKFGLNPLPDSLGRALAAAQKAVEVAVSNAFAYDALAQAHFCRKEFASFRNAAARAIALNPLDGATTAWMGTLIAYSGDWDHGCDIVQRAMQLNPHHPGWYWGTAFFDAYRKGDYRAALSLALKYNLPGLYYQPWMLAIAYGQLGEREAANKSLQDLLALRPDFAVEVREETGKWFNPELVEHTIDGLRKAGLVIDGETGRSGDGVNEESVSPYPTHPLTLSPTHSSGSLIKSIAVLPFQNLSVDPEQEFFADGITEEILNALTQIKELRVAGRSSSFSFKGRNEDLRSVGTKLNVTNILEGTLRRSSDRLRITAQLVDAVSGYQLWSERYDRVVEDIFNIQDEIALAVVDALKLKLFGDAKEAVVKRYTDDAEVHELFLKGRYYSYKYTAEGWTRAVEFFEKVIEKDPDHAPAHAGIAASVGCLWFFGLSPADETVPRFRSAATKALELDGNLAGAHLSLGMVTFFHDWEWDKAEQEFKQAILLNPKDAEALSYYAMFLGFVDRFEEAMALARRALEVDPLSLLINMNVGWTYFSAGLANEAIEQTRKMTEIEPGFFGAYWLIGATCLANGDYEEAIEQLTRAVSLGGHPIVLADLGAAYALAGKKETAAAILDQLLDMRRQSYVPAICLARVYSRLGELEKTIQWLETAYEERNGELVFLESEITSAAQGDSLNSLGKDPRVKALLERMKLPSRDQESK